jgi:hypothetical protein
MVDGGANLGPSITSLTGCALEGRTVNRKDLGLRGCAVIERRHLNANAHEKVSEFG